VQIVGEAHKFCKLMKTIEDQTLEYAEALNDIADILQLPTGVTSAEIVAACRELLNRPVQTEEP
jgi:hypothetical protein